MAGGAKERKLSARSAITKPPDLEKFEMNSDGRDVLHVVMGPRAVFGILLIHTCHTWVCRLIEACEAYSMPFSTCGGSVRAYTSHDTVHASRSPNNTRQALQQHTWAQLCAGMGEVFVAEESHVACA